jgi:hypothetical protein
VVNIRKAVASEAVKITRLLEESLNNGVERGFRINRQKLLNHVQQTIRSADGFAYVAVDDSHKVIGCFMAELVPHAYCDGYVVQELGVYIQPTNRGGRTFIKLLEEFVMWSESKPDVLVTGFTISQLGATTPYVRGILKRLGFIQGSEGYYKI